MFTQIAEICFAVSVSKSQSGLRMETLKRLSLAALFLCNLMVAECNSNSQDVNYYGDRTVGPNRYRWSEQEIMFQTLRSDTSLFQIQLNNGYNRKSFLKFFLKNGFMNIIYEANGIDAVCNSTGKLNDFQLHVLKLSKSRNYYYNGYYGNITIYHNEHEVCDFRVNRNDLNYAYVTLGTSRGNNPVDGSKFYGCMSNSDNNGGTLQGCDPIFTDSSNSMVFHYEDSVAKLSSQNISSNRVTNILSFNFKYLSKTGIICQVRLPIYDLLIFLKQDENNKLQICTRKIIRYKVELQTKVDCNPCNKSSVSIYIHVMGPYTIRLGIDDIAIDENINISLNELQPELYFGDRSKMESITSGYSAIGRFSDIFIFNNTFSLANDVIRTKKISVESNNGFGDYSAVSCFKNKLVPIKQNIEYDLLITFKCSRCEDKICKDETGATECHVSENKYNINLQLDETLELLKFKTVPSLLELSVIHVNNSMSAIGNCLIGIDRASFYLNSELISMKIKFQKQFRPIKLKFPVGKEILNVKSDYVHLSNKILDIEGSENWHYAFKKDIIFNVSSTLKFYHNFQNSSIDSFTLNDIHEKFVEIVPPLSSSAPIVFTVTYLGIAYATSSLYVKPVERNITVNIHNVNTILGRPVTISSQHLSSSETTPYGDEVTTHFRTVNNSKCGVILFNGKEIFDFTLANIYNAHYIPTKVCSEDSFSFSVINERNETDNSVYKLKFLIANYDSSSVQIANVYTSKRSYSFDDYNVYFDENLLKDKNAFIKFVSVPVNGKLIFSDESVKYVNQGDSLPVTSFKDVNIRYILDCDVYSEKQGGVAVDETSFMILGLNNITLVPIRQILIYREASDFNENVFWNSTENVKVVSSYKKQYGRYGGYRQTFLGYCYKFTINNFNYTMNGLNPFYAVYNLYDSTYNNIYSSTLRKYTSFTSTEILSGTASLCFDTGTFPTTVQVFSFSYQYNNNFCFMSKITITK